MKMPWKVLSAVALLVVLVSPAALVGAQKATLDPTADPNYGTWTLAEYPDPFILTIDAGGDVDASAADVGAGCVGYVTGNPDLKFDFGGGTLRAFFASTGDTTLIMYKPDGSYVCNDDGVGANPVIDVANAAAGTYSLWIGTYSSGGLIPGHLVITTGELLPGALVSDLLGSASSSSSTSTTTTTTTNTGGLNPASPATFTTLELAPGFQPDPTEVDMVAGGGVNVGTMGLGPECRGFVASPPDVTVNYSADGRFLRIFFQSQADTTLVVGLPDGTFTCNDDFSGRLDPLIDIEAPAAGAYNIWVGTFSATDTAQGTLVLSNGNTLDPTNS